MFIGEILQLEKFEGTDFKYVKIIFVQEYPKKAFLVPNLSIFVILLNFTIAQIRGS